MHDDLTREFDARDLLQKATQKHGIHLSLLIAETAFWANPKVYEKLREENGTGAWFPGIRRYRPGQGEKRGQILDGIRLDDNTYANQAVKKAIGIPREKLEGFEACHIWPGTCYEHRYHTCIANLMLIPRALAGLTDHDAEIQAALKYRTYELHGWHPEEDEIPLKPQFYPENWQSPFPFTYRVQDAIRRRQRGNRMNSVVRSEPTEPTAEEPPSQPMTTQLVKVGDDAAVMDDEELAFVVGRIQKWAASPERKIHKMIALVVQSEEKGGLSRAEYVDLVGKATGSNNPTGAVASLLTSKSNAYGRALIVDSNRIVHIHPQVIEEVRRHQWTL